MKRFLLAILLILCLGFLAACSSSTAPYAEGMTIVSSEPAAPAPAPAPAAMPTENVSYDMAAEGEYAAPGESGGGYGSVSGLPPGVEARKVVYSADFYIATADFAATMRRLEQKIATSGGYLQNSDSRAATEFSPAYASMTIRVPAALYGDFKIFLADLAELQSSTEHGEDVTAQYFDTEARLKVLQAQEERIKTFIANSKDLDEIFKIERELTRISTEIEQLTTVKNRLDNLTAYATIYVEVRESVEEEIVDPEPASFGERVRQALRGSLDGMVIAAQTLVLFVVWVWPLLAVAAIVLLLWRKTGKRRLQRGKSSPPASKEQEQDDDK